MTTSQTPPPDRDVIEVLSDFYRMLAVTPIDDFSETLQSLTGDVQMMTKQAAHYAVGVLRGRVAEQAENILEVTTEGNTALAIETGAVAVGDFIAVFDALLALPRTSGDVAKPLSPPSQTYAAKTPLSEILRLTSQSLQVTQVRLAELCGMSQASAYRWMHTRGLPGDKFLRAMEALGCGYTITVTRPPPPPAGTG